MGGWGLGNLDKTVLPSRSHLKMGSWKIAVRLSLEAFSILSPDLPHSGGLSREAGALGC